MRVMAMLLLAAWVTWMWSDERARWEPIEEHDSLERCRLLPEMIERALRGGPPVETIEDPKRREMAEALEALPAKTQCLPVGVTPTTPPLYPEKTPYPVRPKL